MAANGSQTVPTPGEMKTFDIYDPRQRMAADLALVKMGLNFGGAIKLKISHFGLVW